MIAKYTYQPGIDDSIQGVSIAHSGEFIKEGKPMLPIDDSHGPSWIAPPYRAPIPKSVYSWQPYRSNLAVFAMQAPKMSLSRKSALVDFRRKSIP